MYSRPLSLLRHLPNEPLNDQQTSEQNQQQADSLLYMYV
jgi:hypothetical protein